jgi:hypothetical protein
MPRPIGKQFLDREQRAFDLDSHWPERGWVEAMSGTLNAFWDIKGESHGRVVARIDSEESS